VRLPTGRDGRPSKSLDLAQAKALLAAAENTRLNAYIVLSLLTGARTEELRALMWSHVDLDGLPYSEPPVPPSIQVWHSDCVGSDTKTRRSRRTLALPLRCVEALDAHRGMQHRECGHAGDRWVGTGLVFVSAYGAPLSAGAVRRSFKRVAAKAGLGSADWTPRELRHSFVSLLSDSGVSLEDIADLCGHSGTTVTEKVYRHQLRPVLLGAAVAMDEIFRPAQ
jgi:integrase